MDNDLLEPSEYDFRRRNSNNSIGLMDTAEDLLDQLNIVAEILAEIEEKYPKDKDDVNEDKQPSVFRKLQDGLESARTLISCLKQEKWRLNKRKISVDMRVGELEDYKSHLKEDMTSMNDTVDVLSFRVIQLENSLCDAQEVEETLKAEKSQLYQRINVLERKYNVLETHKVELLNELKEARSQRSATSLQKENQELRFQVDMLQEEDKCLKEMLRLSEDGTVTDDHVHNATSINGGVKQSGSTSSAAENGILDGNLGIPFRKYSNGQMDRRHLSFGGIDVRLEMQNKY